MDFDIDISGCVAALRSGGIILYPTDTVWGLGCDATDSEAVNRIFDIKQRPDAKSMLILASGMNMAEQYVGSVPEAARRLLDNTDRPTTVIYDGARDIDTRLIADDGSIGIRIPDDGFCQALCRELGHPIVSTSANISGQPTPRSFAEIPQQIIDSADYVCLRRRDEDELPMPSDIYKVSADGNITVIRKNK